MRYGETGVNLEVDLSRGNIEKVETDPRDTELFLGGQGTAAKILWDRVPPETHPLSPDNPLIFGVGPLVGTLAPSANRTLLTTRSPQTNLHHFSALGGFFGPELKHAGYDTLIISRGRKSNDELFEQLEDQARELYKIGDCSKAANILQAVWSANEIARKI